MPRGPRLRWVAAAAAVVLSLSAAADGVDPFASTTEVDLDEGWKSCYSHQTCSECYAASSTCHWCAKDQACHAKPAGCGIGASCQPEPPANNTCFAHQNCTSCTASSWGCHWCASDEKCHAVGSIHGCSAGANCYAIDRCQRVEPERMADAGGTFSKASFQGVGPAAKGVLGVLMGLILCCSTMCFGAATFVKGAVDDLVGEPVELVEDGMLIQGGTPGETVEFAQRDELEIPLMQNDDAEKAEEGESDEKEESEVDNLQRSSSAAMRSGQASVARSRISLSSRRATPRGSSIKRMYGACQLCYLFTVITTVILFIVGMSYAPRQPVTNVCTNQLVWKSIVEGMASLKMSASFDLLISVSNPNRFEVDLSNGAGQFHHDGEYVGSFDIPEGRIADQSVSDIVVKVTFTPDKWQALSLTSEYYQGKLRFILGGHAHVRIPALGYGFQAKFDDIMVNANDPSLDDTHLCACPGWKKPLAEL
ncbi:hypothetical protein ACHAXT_005901 [Thalassiosira profunda]